MPTYEKGGKWITKFMVKGQRPSKITDTREEGEAWELTARAALKLGKPIPDGAKKSVGGKDAASVGGALRSAETLHWARLRNSDKSVSNARLFANWVGLTTPAAEAFAQPKLQEFTKYLIEERRVSNSTLNRYSSALSVLAKFSNLDVKPALPWFKEAQGRVRFFSPEEERAVIALLSQWGKDKERDLFMFLVDTGLRPWEEAGKLKWPNVKEKTVAVLGKNDHWRDVPLTKRAKVILDRRDRTEAGPFAGLNHFTMDGLWNRVRGSIPALKDTVWYTARHTFASRLVQAGVPLTHVARLMGNSAMIVDKVYAHLAPDHLKDAVASLEKFGGGIHAVK
jgi:integrase